MIFTREDRVRTKVREPSFRFPELNQPTRSVFPLGSQESWMPMHRNAILDEVQQLYSVSDRLDALAEQHPLVSDALVTISGSVRNTASLLEVLVEIKMAPLAGMDPANA